MAAPQTATKSSPRAGLRLADGGSTGQQPMLALADGGPTGNGDWLRQQAPSDPTTGAYQPGVYQPSTSYTPPATGMGTEFAPPPRDLTKNPLSENEYNVASFLGHIAPLPIGLAINSNLNNLQVDPDTGMYSSKPVDQQKSFTDYVSDKVKAPFSYLNNLFSSDSASNGVTVGKAIAPSSIQSSDLSPLGETDTGPAPTGTMQNNTPSSTAGATNGGSSKAAYGATSGGFGTGNGEGGGGGNSFAADGGMAAPGGFQRAGQPGAMPSQPTTPPGLSMPGAAQAPAPQQSMHPALAQLHVQNKMANPQVMQQMQAHLTQAIQAGGINPQQIQMMGQLAQSAMQHPELWDKLRQFAIQAGLPDAQNLPPQFSQQICMALLAASHAAAHGDRPGAFADGGKLNGPGTGTSDSIPAHNDSTGQPVKLSNGEYIIPADVVATKGKEFFDNIVRKYHTPAAMQHGR